MRLSTCLIELHLVRLGGEVFSTSNKVSGKSVLFLVHMHHCHVSQCALSQRISFLGQGFRKLQILRLYRERKNMDL